MRVAVAFEGEGTQEPARRLADRLALPFVGAAPSASAPGNAAESAAPVAVLPRLLLVRTVRRLELREAGRAGGDSVWVDFEMRSAGPLLRRATLAATEGVHTLIDATAGLGQDGFALAASGLTVHLIERSPVVAALLADGLDRAREDERTAAAAARVTLHVGDAAGLLPVLPPAQVVYLDPMYPQSGREARKAKGMRLLRELLGEGEGADEALLLEAARRAAARRVTVKRPLRAPFLGEVTPSGSLRGTTVRYDLYPPVLKTTGV